MDSNGNLYGTPPDLDDVAQRQLNAQIEQRLGKLRPMAEAPGDAITLSESAALELATSNRHARRVFFAERRRGRGEDEALLEARKTRP